MFELRTFQNRMLGLALAVPLLLAACGSNSSNPSPGETDSVPVTEAGGESSGNEPNTDAADSGSEDSPKSSDSAPTTLGAEEPSGTTTTGSGGSETGPAVPPATTAVPPPTTSAPPATPEQPSPATSAPPSTFEVETVEPDMDVISTVSPSA